MHAILQLYMTNTALLHIRPREAVTGLWGRLQEEKLPGNLGKRRLGKEVSVRADLHGSDTRCHGCEFSGVNMAEGYGTWFLMSSCLG
jgi:hypothetical protein